MLSSFSFVFPCRALALTLPIFLAGSVLAQDSELAQREIERRQAAVQEGQMLLLKGDEAYQAANYQEAIDAYAGARDSFPDAPATAELRKAAAQRLAQASVEQGKELSRKGDVAGAKETMDKILVEDVAEDDVLANEFRAQLDDPIRTNPSITKEYSADVDEVRRTLYMAQGAFDLGKYDEANRHYEDVLRIDPYNKAARRGMEKVASQKSSYADAAYDQTRAELLGQVTGAWELPLAPDLIVPEFDELTELGTQGDFVSVSNKLSRIVIPEFRVEGATILEAIDLVRLRAAENDQFESDPRKKGINITVNLGDVRESPGKEILTKSFDLNVSNVPLDQILRYIADITGTIVKTDEFAVTLVPAGFGSTELITRTYRVPPDFLSNLTLSTGRTEESNDDIFNQELGDGGLLAERMGAQEALGLQGVSFPEGASASLTSTSNILRVTNTAGNLDVIEQIIDSVALTEPVSVAIRVTMLKVEKNQLEELGFDWLVNNFELSNDVFATGGTTGNGTPITPFPSVPTNPVPLNPITAGNRSGDGAIFDNSIDSLLASGSSRGTQESNRAPGILGVNGLIDNATVQLLMRGLDQKKGVDIMSQPSVTTRSGQAASIMVVDEFIYPTEYEPPELPTSVGGNNNNNNNGNNNNGGGGDPSGSFPVTPATPTAFEKRDVGVVLEVLPVADANKQYVDVTLNPSITDFDGFVNYGSPINAVGTGPLGLPTTTTLTENAILMPVFSVRRTNSNLVVADGATIVIGGLLKDEVQNVEDRTPILGDIPVIGRLFASDSRSHKSTAILFLVNVQLLDPTGRPYKDR